MPKRRIFAVLLKQQRCSQGENDCTITCRSVAWVADIDQIRRQQYTSEDGPVPVGFNLLAMIGAEPAREGAVLLAAAD